MTCKPKTGVAAAHAPDYLGLVLFRDKAGREETPASLGAHVVRDETRNLRQVLAPAALADIVTDADGRGYRIDFFHADDLQPQRTPEGLHAPLPGTQPLRTWSFRNPSPEHHNHLRVTKSTGGRQEVSDFTYSPDADSWTLVRGGGLVRKHVENMWSDDRSILLETKYQIDHSNNRMDERATRFGLVNGVYRATREVRDPKGEAFATDYTHYTAPSDGRRLGKVRSAVRSDGSWTRYEYDDEGRPVRATVRHADGQPHYVEEDGVRKATHRYGVNPDGTQWTTLYEGPAGDASPVWTKTTTDILGRVVLEERPGFSEGGAGVPPAILSTTHAYEPGTGRHLSTSTGYRVEGSPVLHALGSTLFSYDELGDLVRTVQYLDLDGQVSLAGPDRVADTHSEYVQLDGDWFRETRQYLYPEDNDVPRLVATQRRRLTGLGVAEPAHSAGALLVAESLSLDLPGNPAATREYIDRDAKTVWQVVDSLDSSLPSVATTVNGQVVSTRTATGVLTEFQYDALDRRVLSTTASGAGTPPSRTVASATAYDALGQIDHTEDILGHRTTYGYDPATGRQIATTDAFGNTTHTAYDLEGRVVATWGAIYPVAYAYDAHGRMTAMATTRDHAHDSANLLTLLRGLTHHRDSEILGCWILLSAISSVFTGIYISQRTLFLYYSHFIARLQLLHEPS